MSSEITVNGKSVVIFNGSEFGQNDGWYFQVETEAGSNAYDDPIGPFRSEQEATEKAQS